MKQITKQYRKFIKDKCERCGISDKRILIGHHKDGNRENNAAKNIQTFCRNCHYLVHLEIDEKNKLNKLATVKIEVFEKDALELTGRKNYIGETHAEVLRRILGIK